MAADLAGSGDIDGSLGLIAWVVANLIGHGDLDLSVVRSDMYMGASITSAGDLVTAASCAAAVWSALASAFDVVGTMGNKLNSAGSAGDPWTALVDGELAGTTLAKLKHILSYKTITDPVTGIMTVYDTDGTTPLLTAQLYQDADGTIKYKGSGAELRERLM
jgi:hypothetical protein